MRNALKLQPEFFVRAAALEDLRGVVRVERHCFNELDRYPKFILEGYIKASLYDRRSGIAMLVAHDENTGAGVVGYCMSKIGEGPHATLFTLGVAPSHRRFGIGSKLLEATSASLRDTHQIISIKLHVGVINRGAIRMYEHNGFVPEGTIPDYYGPGRDALCMLRRLG